MLKGLRNVVMVSGIGLGLAGCHSFHKLTHSCDDTTDRYDKAVSVAPMRVPLGIDAPDTKSALQIPALNEPPPPARKPKDPCLDEPPRFVEPRGPRPAPAV